MDEWQILNRILDLRKRQEKSKKFIGALTMEIVRNELITRGLIVSNRNVFIEGISNELDLLILRPNSTHKENLLYNPEDVLYCLEIKFRGIYNKSGIETITNIFNKINEINDKIKCTYLTISERSKRKNRITKEKLGNKYECFELFTRNTTLERALKNNTLKATGDWENFLEMVKN